MQQTSVSLLERLAGRPAEADWRRLTDIYTPYIRRWLRDPALSADADDLLQDVLTTLVKELPNFRRERTGSFRAWLRTITANRVNLWWRQRRNRPDAPGGTDHALRLLELADPASGLSKLWDQEHDAHVIQRVMELLEPEFEPDTWRAFRRQVIDGMPASAVADEFKKSVNAVLLAKSRVLRRVREEAAGLLGDENA